MYPSTELGSDTLDQPVYVRIDSTRIDAVEAPPE